MKENERFYGFTEFRGKAVGRGRDGHGSENQINAGLALFHDEAAGFTDESGSSLSDTFNDVDMGGGAAGAIPMPPGGGVAGNAHLDKMTRRARCARRTHTACWLVPSGTPT